jgi:hypothetical protein
MGLMRKTSLYFTLLHSIAVVALFAGCGESNPSTSGAGGDGAGGDGSSGTSTATSAGPGSGAGGMGTGGAPPCAAETLADAVRATSISIMGGTPTRAITAQAGSGSVVAWGSSDGNIHITPLDAVDERSGADILVDGSQVFGVAAGNDDVALLVSRPPDFMTFVRVDLAGNVLATTNLVGGGDHNTVGIEWFGEFAQTGRLVAKGDGTYAAYHALHRRWPDNVGHQGDTLRLLDASGSPLGGGWDWGCSHSLDQRLAAGPNGIVPICISDCYPSKGIHFNHNGGQITPDPGANCAGGYSTRLGGLVAVSSGFFLVYKDGEGGAHLGAFDAGGKPTSDRALTVTGESRLARYADGMLMGSDGGSGTSLQRLDSTGKDVGGPAMIAQPLPDHDFEGRSDGEVAWAHVTGDTLTVIRVRVCQ